MTVGKIGRASRVEDPKVTHAILEHIRNGVPKTRAAVAAGIAERTWYTWRARAEKEPDGPYGCFFQDVTRAESECVANLVGVIREGCYDDRRGPERAMWLLEKRDPHYFGSSDRRDVDRELAMIYEKARETLGDEAYAALLQAIARAQDGEPEAGRAPRRADG